MTTAMPSPGTTASETNRRSRSRLSTRGPARRSPAAGVARGERLRQAEGGDAPDQRGDGSEHDEDRAPAPLVGHRAADGRGEQRGDGDDEHQPGEQPGGVGSRVAVADDGDRHHGGPRCGEALRDPQPRQRGDRGRHGAQHGQQGVEAQADQGRRPAPHPVGPRPDHELADGAAEHHPRDRELRGRSRGAEVGCDLGERGQVHVGRHGWHERERPDQGDEPGVLAPGGHADVREAGRGCDRTMMRGLASIRHPVPQRSLAPLRVWVVGGMLAPCAAGTRRSGRCRTSPTR